MVAALVLAACSSSDGNEQVQDLDATTEASPGTTPVSEATPGGSTLVIECIDFANALLPALSGGDESAQEISDLASEATDDAPQGAGPAWQADVEAVYDQMRSTRERVASLQAPTDGLEQVKAVLLEGYDEFLASEAPLLEGARALDTDEIGQAENLIVDATDTITEARVLLTSFDVLECFE